jgi:formylglycine-generating enzyme required for sulfatase activity
VIPSSRITWFQAQQACFNARKRLPSNAEWQGAVAGTPDPGPDNGTTDCNTDSVHAAVNTGSRSACVSRFGAFDMVGNLYEWVADWVPRSLNCGSWSISDDLQCLQGVATSGEPGVLVRGGSFASLNAAGPFSINGGLVPSQSSSGGGGFRCAR